VIVSLQLQKGKRVEAYLRCVTPDDHVETVRRTVTAMLAHPKDHAIGNKYAGVIGGGLKRGRKPQPVKRSDDERADGEPQELQAT
jgi:hypothetical protein